MKVMVRREQQVVDPPTVIPASRVS